MSEEIPTTMKRLVVTAPGEDIKSCKIEIEEVSVPKPSSSEVLIKVVASAINPSDYGSWFRCKPDQCPLPMGLEGCGVVVACGGGLLTSFNCPVGTKVGFTSLKGKQGSYSEFVVADAFAGVFPMTSDLPIEDAASFFVNPYTAIGILDTVESEGAKAFVHTAAASQLGQMLVKVAPSRGIEIINVVRREEQAEILKNLGAMHIIVTGGGNNDGEESWKESLQNKIKDLNASVGFDAVAGRMSGDILDSLPNKGTLYIYGGLAGNAENINPMNLIYRQKKMKGWYLKKWVTEGGLLSMAVRMKSASNKVNEGLNGGWSSTQFTDTTFENAHNDIVNLLDSKATGKKLRIRIAVS